MLGRESEIVSPWRKGKESLLRCRTLSIACLELHKKRTEMLGLREAEAVVMAAARFRKTLGHRMDTSPRMVLLGAHTDTERREIPVPCE